MLLFDMQLDFKSSCRIIIKMNASTTTVSGKTKLKIVLLGNANVGKTCIIDQYVHNRFEESSNSTVGIDFLAKNVNRQGKNYRLQLWDTAGQQRFRSIIPNYLKDSYCALLVFDVTSKASLAEIQMWKKLFQENTVANKIDLQYREISEQEGKKKAQRMNIPYFQVSAKTAQNLNFLFDSLLDYYNNKSIQGTNLFAVGEKQKQNHSDLNGIQVVKQQKQQQQNYKEQVQTQKNDKKAKQFSEKTNTHMIDTNQTIKNVQADNTIVLNSQKKSQEEKAEKKKKCC